jgi:hypothetical protein
MALAQLQSILDGQNQIQPLTPCTHSAAAGIWPSSARNRSLVQHLVTGALDKPNIPPFDEYLGSTWNLETQP